jgi:hypothetical protein
MKTYLFWYRREPEHRTQIEGRNVEDGVCEKIKIGFEYRVKFRKIKYEQLDDWQDQY